MLALGVTTAAMCFSKLQSAPIALTLALAALLLAWMARRGRLPGAACLVLGAAVVSVAFCALFLYHGVFDEFWQSYVARTSLTANSPAPLAFEDTRNGADVPRPG